MAERWERGADERHFFRATFDQDPAAYAASRPVAPAEVFDDLVSLAGLRPGSDVVEVGPGTGQATRPLAERGLRVLAVELGPGLAARAREDLADLPDVEVVNADFETWESPTTFDAVFSCNAFHWIDPATRFSKSHSLLRPGPSGHLAVLATSWVIPDDADRFWWDVQDDWEAIGAERIDPAIHHPDLVRDLSPSLRASGLFDDPVIRRYPFHLDFTADGYVTNLSTQSGNKDLAPEVRQELFERVRRRIEARGGSIRADLLGVLVVAKAR